MRNGQIVCRCGHEKAYHFAGPCCIKTIGGLGLVESNCKCRKYSPRSVKIVWVFYNERANELRVTDTTPYKPNSWCGGTWHRKELLVP